MRPIGVMFSLRLYRIYNMPLNLDALRILVENLNVGICVLDQDNKIVVFNRKVAEQLQQDADRIDN